MLEPENKKRVGDEIKPQYKDEGRLGRLKRGMYSRLKQPVSRPRRELPKLSPSTKENWEVEDKEQDEHVVQELSKSKPFLTIWAMLAGAFALLSVAAAVAYIVGGAGAVSAGRVDIRILGPHTISGGSILELNVSVTNNNPEVLELADLLVHYPSGTRVPTDLATDMTTQRIPLGVIPAGSTRSGTVRAAVFGVSGDNKDIAVELEYRTKGSNALFVAEGHHNILITSDTLDVVIEANEESISGQQVDMVVTVASRAGVLLRDVILRADYPFGFLPDKFDPRPTDGEDYWEIGDMAPGEEYTLRVSGKVKGESGDERTVRFRTGLRSDKTDTTIETELAKAKHIMELQRPFLGVAMLVEDYTTAKYRGHTGETVPVEIYWKNNLPVALSNVVLAASIYGEGVDPYTVSADKGFYRSIDSVAIWDKTTTKGELGSLAAGAKGSFLLRITPRVREQLIGKEDPVINIEIHAAGQRLSETGVPETLQSTVKEVIKIASDVTLSSRALYRENPFTSVGPLPPRVHKETTYAIVWEVTNTTNKMRDVTVSAVLPPYIRWLGVVSPVAENVVYKQAEGSLTWHLGTVLPGTGVGGGEPRRVAFNIGFVPSASQVGASPPLVTDQLLKGFDLFAEQELEMEASELNTELEEEGFVSGQGTVQP